MAANLYRDTGYSLKHLVEDIGHGNIGLPDIQRPFVWLPAKVRDLFDSLYKGYPVGTLLFWETGFDPGTRPVGGDTGDGQSSVPRRLIVDGQQRLTALYSVLTGTPVLNNSFATKQIQIAFRPSDETFEVADAAIRKDPEFIPNITALWTTGYRSTVRTFLARLGDSRGAELSEDENDALEDRIDRVRDLQDFRFQVIELNAEAREEQVADIFVRINSQGVQLKQSDFIMTLLSVHWEKGRRELEAFCRDALTDRHEGPSPRNVYIDPSPDQLLRAGVGLAFRRARLQHVYNILRGKDLETGNISAERRIEQFSRLRQAQDEVLDLTNWHEFLKCLQAAGFHRKRLITSPATVINSYILWLIGRRDFDVDYRTLRGVIARWFFMAQTTGRYTGSAETALEADLNRIVTVTPGDGEAFCILLDRVIETTFTNDYWTITLPNRLDTSSPKSPALCAYWAALHLLDAEVLLGDLKISRLLETGVNVPRSLERHHLFPKARLADLGITTQTQVNAIANMALLDWPENTAITAHPREYWPEMSSKLGPERLRQQIYWHALPEAWEQLDFADFLERRRSLMAAVTRDGFNQLWDKPPEPQPNSALTSLLTRGESQLLEFKSTARWNVRAGLLDKRMEHVVVKTVCGFLNSEGGKLIIGVDDDGNVRGLADDMATLRKPNRDGYELFLRQHLDVNLSVPTAGIVSIGFEPVGDAEVCVVTVSPSGKPVFAKALEGKQPPSEFWVRTGNATKQLHGDDMMDYRASHWG